MCYLYRRARLGGSKRCKLLARGRPSGEETEGERSTTSVLKEPVELSYCFALGTLASVPGLAPWRMVVAALYSPYPATDGADTVSL